MDDLNKTEETEYSYDYEVTEDQYYTSDKVNEALRKEAIRERESFDIREMPVTIILVIVNILIFLYGLTKGSDAFVTGGVNADYVLINGEYLRFISYMFLHANFVHLASNMLALALFGRDLEKRIGSLSMIIIYAISGVFGAIISMSMNHLIDPDQMVFCIGASGAIFGIMSANTVMKARASGNNLRGLIMGIVYILLYAIISLSSGVDFWCHIGGGIAGAVVAFIISFGNWEDYNEHIYKRVIGVVLTLILCIVAFCSSGIGKEASELPDERVDFIKSYEIPSDSSVTFGELFDEKFDKGKWEGFTSVDELEVVQFTGKILYEQHYREVTIQFVLSEDLSSYELWYIGIEDMPATQQNMNDFLNYLFK